MLAVMGEKKADVATIQMIQTLVDFEKALYTGPLGTRSTGDASGSAPGPSAASATPSPDDVSAGVGTPAGFSSGRGPLSGAGDGPSITPMVHFGGLESRHVTGAQTNPRQRSGAGRAERTDMGSLSLRSGATSPEGKLEDDIAFTAAS